MGKRTIIARASDEDHPILIALHATGSTDATFFLTLRL
jgi:predicted esterase